MHRFYAPNIASECVLPQEESQHAVRVLRLAEGDEVEVIDGAGSLYRCAITNAHAKHCELRIVECIQQPPHWGCEIVIGIAPTKNIDRTEWALEKCTEIGIDRVVPLKCRYSERKEIKDERLDKILVSAMKQSLKAQKPILESLTPVGDLLRAPFTGQKFIAYCGDEYEKKLFTKEYEPGSDVMVLIGPEGDFSLEEVKLAVECGFIPVSLGESRLRTETAAVYACMAIHAINNK